MTSKAKYAILTLENGNLTEATELAKKFSSWKIMSEAENLGYNMVECVAIAAYLKGVITFQKYCDTMTEERMKKGLQ